MPFVVFLILVFSEKRADGIGKQERKSGKKKKSLQQTCQVIVPIISALFVTVFFLTAIIVRIIRSKDGFNIHPFSF